MLVKKTFNVLGFERHNGRAQELYRSKKAKKTYWFDYLLKLERHCVDFSSRGFFVNKYPLNFDKLFVINSLV